MVRLFLDKLSLEERLNERILECEKEYDKLDHTTDSGYDFDKTVELESEERTLQRVKDLINKEKCITFDKELEEKITRQVVSETHRYETDIIKSVFQKLRESIQEKGYVKEVD